MSEWLSINSRDEYDDVILLELNSLWDSVNLPVSLCRFSPGYKGFVFSVYPVTAESFN